MIRMISEENVAVTTQNIADNGRDVEYALEKKVIGHGSPGSGSKNFHGRRQIDKKRVYKISSRSAVIYVRY